MKIASNRHLENQKRGKKGRIKIIEIRFNSLLHRFAREDPRKVPVREMSLQLKKMLELKFYQRNLYSNLYRYFLDLLLRTSS